MTWRGGFDWSRSGSSLFKWAAVLGAVMVGLAGCCAEGTRVKLGGVDSVPGVVDAGADGRVIRVNATSGEVWVDLTRGDRLKAGMRFACFDYRLGVTTEGKEAKGVGSVEVMEAGEEISVCRIVSMEGRRGIQAGDLVYNAVFHKEKNRMPRFAIFGEFDIDGDGVATAAERERLETLIRAWGGEVDREVRIRTDYLVAGMRPRSPSAMAEDRAAGSVVARRELEQKRYDGAMDFARQYAVPVLNTNRVLRLTGYYDQAVVRR